MKLINGVGERGIFEILLMLFFRSSGDLMEGELYSALKEEEASESVSSTNFSGEMHFYELVEDTKDGIWLVQVPETMIEVNLFLPKWHSPVGNTSVYLCQVS